MRTVEQIKSEIAMLEKLMVIADKPKMQSVWVLVRENRSLIDSYHYRCQFKQKAAAVRLANKLMAQGYGELEVMEYDTYVARGYDSLTKKVRSLMNGQEVEISINTPNCCDPSSETYWSM